MSFLTKEKKPQEKNVFRQIPGKKGFKSVAPQNKHFVNIPPIKKAR
jgi:hypothetical protein